MANSSMSISKYHIPIQLTELGLKGNGIGVGPKTFVIHTLHVTYHTHLHSS